MKSILAYGDSLTWGAVPGSDGRHPFEDRWPNVLEAELDGNVRVVENGLNGRTTVHDDPFSMQRNGAQTLPGLLDAHSPLDLLIVMLGTNDLNHVYGLRAFEAMQGIDRLVEIVQHHPYTRNNTAPEVIIVSPPHLCAAEGDADYNAYFDASIGESAKLSEFYARVAEERSCRFFDAAAVADVSPLDGCHLDAENTRAIGRGLAPLVREVLAI